MVFFMFLCEHSWDPPGANFALFQRCQHRFKRTEADIQLRAQFPRRNPPIRADELMETLLISWCDSSAWPYGTCLVFHVPVATAETRQPPPHCANIHCLFSVNVQQASLNVIGCNFFPREEFQLHTFAAYALPCQTPFSQTAPLLSSVARQQNLTEYWREGSSSTAISPTSASDFVGHRNSIGVINFGATLVYHPVWHYGTFLVAQHASKPAVYKDAHYDEDVDHNRL